MEDGNTFYPIVVFGGTLLVDIDITMMLVYGPQAQSRISLSSRRLLNYQKLIRLIKHYPKMVGVVEAFTLTLAPKNVPEKGDPGWFPKIWRTGDFRLQILPTRALTSFDF